MLLSIVSTGSDLKRNNLIPGEMVTADLFGPNNGSYGILLTDKYSGFMMGKGLKNISEASGTLIILFKQFKQTLISNW